MSPVIVQEFDDDVLSSIYHEEDEKFAKRHPEADWLDTCFARMFAAGYSQGWTGHDWKPHKRVNAAYSQLRRIYNRGLENYIENATKAKEEENV